MVYLLDGYLDLPEKKNDEDKGHEKAQRFFRLASSLPMELQMILCNRAYEVADLRIKVNNSDMAFRKFARDWEMEEISKNESEQSAG